jgi:hypothetical protein
MNLRTTRTAFTGAVAIALVLSGTGAAAASRDQATDRSHDSCVDLTWHQEEPTVSPPEKTYGAMAHDSAAGTTVLFGGSASVGWPDDVTWMWDGTDWTQARLRSAPTPRGRYDFAMAYDAARGEIVIFGGDANEGEALDDTWVLKGGVWTERHPAMSPPANYGLAMAYDPIRREVVMIGISGHATWIWDGVTWSSATRRPRHRSGSERRSRTTRPDRRSCCSVAMEGRA